MAKTKTNIQNFNPGKKIFGWRAFDYHPHRRGWLWFSVFCLVFLGSATGALIVGDWVMSVTLFVAAAVYFLVHRNGDEVHEVQVFENGILIDRKYIPIEKFSGFWFVYDETASILKLQMNGKIDQLASLQMGECDPEFFRKNFARLDLPELTDKKEGLLDLWIRALKL